MEKEHVKERVFNLSNGCTDKGFCVQSNVTQNPSVLPEIIKKKHAQTIKLSNAFPFVNWAEEQRPPATTSRWFLAGPELHLVLSLSTSLVGRGRHHWRRAN